MELLLQFLSQGFEIFRMSCSSHGQKTVGNRILIQGSIFGPKKFKTGQNFQKLYSLSQQLHIHRACCSWVLYLITLKINCFLVQKRSKFSKTLFFELATSYSQGILFLGTTSHNIKNKLFFGPKFLKNGQNFQKLYF